MVVHFSTFLSTSSGRFALSGGKSRLSGGWADHSRPVWAEHWYHTHAFPLSAGDDCARAAT